MLRAPVLELGKWGACSAHLIGSLVLNTCAIFGLAAEVKARYLSRQVFRRKEEKMNGLVSWMRNLLTDSAVSKKYPCRPSLYSCESFSVLGLQIMLEEAH